MTPSGLEYFVPAQSLVHLQRSQTPVVQREQLEVPSAASDFRIAG